MKISAKCQMKMRNQTTGSYLYIKSRLVKYLLKIITNLFKPILIQFTECFESQGQEKLLCPWSQMLAHSHVNHFALVDKVYTRLDWAQLMPSGCDIWSHIMVLAKPITDFLWNNSLQKKNIKAPINTLH